MINLFAVRPATVLYKRSVGLYVSHCTWRSSETWYSNVVTAHAISVKPLYNLDNSTWKVPTFSSTRKHNAPINKILSAWAFRSKPIAKIRLFSQISKKSHSYRQKVVSLQHILTLNPADNGDWHSFGILWPGAAAAMAGGEPLYGASLLGGYSSGQNPYV